MTERPRPDLRSAGALRAAAQRFTFITLIAAAVGLLILGKADPATMERARVAIADSVVPLLAVLSRPAEALARGIDESRRWLTVYEDNARLREERDRLLTWQATALRLEDENAALRRLLALVPEPEARSVSARVVADSGGAFANSVLVFGGESFGIGIGDVVLTGEGVAGRIVGVAPHSARILLISDLNSRIPVVLSPSRVRAILAGDNTEMPRLIHLTSDAPTTPGERVVTSGDAGAFPPGLPVGVVASVDDGLIRVKPYVERARLDYVRIVDFGLRGIVGSRAERAEQDSARRPNG